MDRRARRYLNEVQGGDHLRRSAFGKPHSTETWGHVELMMPVSDMMALVARNPRLISRDKAERDEAWDEFMKSDEARAYKVPARDKSRIVLSGTRRDA